MKLHQRIRRRRYSVLRLHLTVMKWNIFSLNKQKKPTKLSAIYSCSRAPCCSSSSCAATVKRIPLQQKWSKYHSLNKITGFTFHRRKLKTVYCTSYITWTTSAKQLQRSSIKSQSLFSVLQGKATFKAIRKSRKRSTWILFWLWGPTSDAHHKQATWAPTTCSNSAILLTLKLLIHLSTLPHFIYQY